MILSSIIPFVSTLNDVEERLWLDVLSKSMPNESVLPLRKLTDKERKLVDVAIVANPDPTDLQVLPNLVWVHSVWAGVEKMLQQRESPRYSIVRLVDPELSRAMTEAVLAWTLFLHRDMPAYAHQQSRALWQPLPYFSAKDRSVGVLGLGELGQQAAQALEKQGFQVQGWSRTEKHIANISCLFGEEGLAQILEQSDILVCLLPLTPHTEGLLGSENLAKIKPGAQLINFARGKIIDEDALLYELNTGRIKHAVLDVFMYEPLPRSHPFWTHPNITVLPHISAPTTPQSAAQIVAQNIRNYRHLSLLPKTVDTQLGY
ncbi:2-hydroxyacid dehydrogenase [Marinomonas fungiae]|uniref:Phosphoglycerate dehydrogenase or related dehydrogenase n=1 Tax=Marinomonas fungiae TaxID=1137284 RepID=A0A0K6IHM5_9GAMM|nr:glyoxylate/hydroxypyruvate reductase A [Marinomonas fungiae]CUB02604.1 Phosphoglycerate dehydrogenase or related dehydrogenase [Marinomonas fungiae]